MNIHNVTQGSPEWHALRAEHFNASEAPAIMGASKYITRSKLLEQKATGIVPEVDAATQRRFDDGHATEANARAILERRIGEDLYPIVATRGKMLASVDGIDMLESTLFEHKLLNQDLVAMVEAGELSPAYYWQLEQQLFVTGAERVLFVCSDGTEENFHMMEYRAVPGRIEQLLAGWEQFAADLAAYEHKEAAPEVVGKAPETLPALRIELTGMVTASNLQEFKSSALAVIDSVSEDLETDQDFADAEKAVKWCKEVEDKLAAAKQHALSQTASIDELFRTIDDIAENARQKRLAIDKLVKRRKDDIRTEIVMEAAKKLQAHIDQINETLGGKVRLPEYRADFNGAIKGKKTVASLQDAADTALAQAKIETSQIADRYRANIAVLRDKAAGHERLFPDAQQLVAKQTDDLEAVIAARIAEHKAAEEKRLAEERERIRAEEEAKLKDAAQPEPAPAPEKAERIIPVTQPGTTTECETIKLGEINARLAPISVTADGLASLGITPVGKERSAVLYRAADWSEICQRLVDHIIDCEALVEHVPEFAKQATA